MEAMLEKVDNITVIVLPGESLNAGNAKDFKRVMRTKLAGQTNVVFDMSKLKSLDSSGLGAILFCLRQLNANGGDLKIYGMLNPVRALFVLVRMHRVFNIYNTKEEAIAAFRQ